MEALHAHRRDCARRMWLDSLDAIQLENDSRVVRPFQGIPEHKNISSGNQVLPFSIH